MEKSSNRMATTTPSPRKGQKKDEGWKEVVRKNMWVIFCTLSQLFYFFCLNLWGEKGERCPFQPYMIVSDQVHCDWEAPIAVHLKKHAYVKI